MIPYRISIKRNAVKKKSIIQKIVFLLLIVLIIIGFPFIIIYSFFKKRVFNKNTWSKSLHSNTGHHLQFTEAETAILRRFQYSVLLQKGTPKLYKVIVTPEIEGINDAYFTPLFIENDKGFIMHKINQEAPYQSHLIYFDKLTSKISDTINLGKFYPTKINNGSGKIESKLKDEQIKIRFKHRS